MAQMILEGPAAGAQAIGVGLGNALRAAMIGDKVQQDAYLKSMGSVKQAEEARGLKMTNDHRENADRYATDETLSPHHKAALMAFKLLGADADKFSRSASIEQEIGSRDAIIKDPSLTTNVAKAFFATSGKAPYDNVGNTGHSINQATGEQIVANPAIAKLFQNRQATGGKAPSLSLSQQRSNAEIDAARETVAGLTPEEIRLRTAKTTDTGRENPNYDPTLARSATLAGRRKIGTDQTFDNRTQQAAPPPAAPTVTSRFQADPAMKAYKLGAQTPNGFEVKDSAGKVVGYYR